MDLCFLRAIQGPSGGIPISPELMNYTLIPSHLERAHLPQRNFVEFSFHFGEWCKSGRKREG